MSISISSLLYYLFQLAKNYISTFCWLTFFWSCFRNNYLYGRGDTRITLASYFCDIYMFLPSPSFIDLTATDVARAIAPSPSQRCTASKGLIAACGKGCVKKERAQLNCAVCLRVMTSQWMLRVTKIGYGQRTIALIKTSSIFKSQTRATVTP